MKVACFGLGWEVGEGEEVEGGEKMLPWVVSPILAEMREQCMRILDLEAITHDFGYVGDTPT